MASKPKKSVSKPATKEDKVVEPAPKDAKTENADAKNVPKNYDQYWEKR